MGFEIGEVISRKNGYVNVRLPKKASCEHCHGCSLGTDDKYMVTQAIDPLGAEIGQRVKLEFADLSPLKYGFILYITPLILFLSAYLLAEWLGKSFTLSAATIQALSVLAGFFCFALPFAGLVLINRNRKKKQQWSIRVVEIEPNDADVEASGSTPEA